MRFPTSSKVYCVRACVRVTTDTFSHVHAIQNFHESNPFNDNPFSKSPACNNCYLCTFIISTKLESPPLHPFHIIRFSCFTYSASASSFTTAFEMPTLSILLVVFKRWQKQCGLSKEHKISAKLTHKVRSAILLFRIILTIFSEFSCS